MCLTNYIETNGIKFHWGFKLLPKDFIAITLFGHVFSNLSKKELEEYLSTKRGKQTINHERIHILQAKSFKLKYFTFYILYLWYWIIGLFKYGIKDNISYYNIPFEKEAFANDNNPNYNKTNWKNYK
jgi:hypothetical protein